MKRVKHSAKLSEIEIDMRLKEYFSDHQIMQRSDFQGITGMAQSLQGTLLYGRSMPLDFCSFLAWQ